MSKIIQKTYCSVCKKLRILTYYPENKQEKKEIRAEIEKMQQENSYVCSDCY